MTRRIVQLTDCHLFADATRELRGIVTWPRLAAVVDDVRRRVPDFDLLVLSGDTAHDEEPATYESVRKELGDLAGRVQIIPGNHDDRQALHDVFPDSTSGLAGRVTFHVRWDDWQVIGLDSRRPGELPGSLGDEQLAWLRARLDAAPRVNALLFLHHPPVAVASGWLDKIGLQDVSQFEQTLRGHAQVRLIACGHVHQELAASLGGATVVTTPAVGPQFRPRTEQLEIDPAPPAYRVLELHADGRWLTQVLRCRSVGSAWGDD
jgi:Icc protein